MAADAFAGGDVDHGQADLHGLTDLAGRWVAGTVNCATVKYRGDPPGRPPGRRRGSTCPSGPTPLVGSCRLRSEFVLKEQERNRSG